MKIAVNGMLLSRRSSGVEVSILNLARALSRFGSEDYLFYVPARFPERKPEGTHFRTIKTGVPAHFRPARILWEQFVLPEIISRERVDLLHAPGYIAPLRANVPVVITLYDIIALLFPGWCKVSNYLHYRIFLPLSVKKAAGIIVPSDFTGRDVVKRFPVAENKVRVIHLGVNSDFRVIRDDDRFSLLRKKYDLGEKFILFVGKQEPKKNLVRLVEAFHGLRSQGSIRHKLVVAGEKGWQCSPIFRRIRELGLQAEVVFTGFIPPEELPYMYNMADLFVFPSLYEGFGLPPLEAMACGVPVVCSNRGAIPEVVGDAALLFNPLDIPGMAGAMKEAITNHQVRRDLVNKGMERAKLFSWQKTAEATEHFYREVYSLLCI